MRVVRLYSTLTMLMGRSRPGKQRLGGDTTSIIASIGRSVIGMKSTIRTSMHFCHRRAGGIYGPDYWANQHPISGLLRDGWLFSCQ